jgi:hypothetical protein
VNYRKNEDKLPCIVGSHNSGLTIETVTDLTTEPVTLIQAKDYLHIDGSDDDTVITALITTARQMVEGFSGYSFGAKTLKLYLDEYRRGKIDLLYGPVDEVTTVALDGVTATVSEDYKRLGNEKVFMYTGYQNLEITYTTKADVKQWMKSAVLAQLAFLYEHRGDESISHVCEAAQTIVGPFIRLNVF